MDPGFVVYKDLVPLAPSWQFCSWGWDVPLQIQSIQLLWWGKILGCFFSDWWNGNLKIFLSLQSIETGSPHSNNNLEQAFPFDILKKTQNSKKKLNNSSKRLQALVIKFCIYIMILSAISLPIICAKLHIFCCK